MKVVMTKRLSIPKRNLIRGFLTLTCLSTAISAVGRDRAPLPEEAYLGSITGARHIALGKALTGTGDDGNSLFWNPAGLNLLPIGFFSMTFRSQHLTGLEQLINPTLSGRGLSSIAISTSQTAMGWRALARVSMEDPFIEVSEGETTEVMSQEYLIDEYLLAITTVGAGGALSPEENFLMGINIKYLRGELGIAQRRIVNGQPQEPEVNLDRGNGYGIGLGTLLDWRTLSLGFSIQNLLAKLYWNDYQAERVNPNLLGGGTFRPSEWLTLAGALEHRWRRGTSMVFHVGAEAIFARLENPQWYGFLISFSPSFRFGAYGTDLSKREQTVFTGGLGYVYSRYQLDTGVYGNDMSDLGYVATLSIPF